jgi:hypothetical protein
VTTIVRSIAGVFTTIFMLRQHDPCAGALVSPRASALREIVLPLADRGYRKLLGYRAVWGVATGLTASLSAVFTLRALGLGFTGIAIYAAVIAALRVVTTPIWGRTLDRVGGRFVLVTCSAGATLSSLSWALATAGSAWLIRAWLERND